MSSQMPFSPADPKNIAIRPLKIGVIKDLPLNQLPMGAFDELKGYLVSAKGLKRRGGNLQLGSSVNAADVPLLDIVSLNKVTGLQTPVLITSRYIYTLSLSAAPSPVYWAYTTGLVSVSGSTMTGYGTEWADAVQRLLPGDIVVLNTGGTPEYNSISSVTDNKTIVLTSAPSGTYTITDKFQYGNCEDATHNPTFITDGGNQELTYATFARSTVNKLYGTYSWLYSNTDTSTDKITNGNCEAVTTPTLDTTYYGLSAGCTWARSSDEIYSGYCSWKLSAPIGGDLTQWEQPFYVYLDNSGLTGTSDLNGLTAGTTYDFSFALKSGIAFASSCLLSKWGTPSGYLNKFTCILSLDILEYYSSAWHTTNLGTVTQVMNATSWVLTPKSITLNGSTAGVTLRLSIQINYDKDFIPAPDVKMIDAIVGSTGILHLDSLSCFSTLGNLVYLDAIGKSATNKMHGLSANTSYTFSAALYTDCPNYTSARLEVHEYYASAWYITATLNPTTFKTWQTKMITFTTNASTTGVTVKCLISSGTTAYNLYIDNVNFFTGGTAYSIRRVLNA
jgi:hypothetical protein